MENIVDALKSIKEKKTTVVINEEGIQFSLIDADLDVFECSFYNNETVSINTEGCNHIILTKENLQELLKIMKESEKYYKRNTNFLCD